MQKQSRKRARRTIYDEVCVSWTDESGVRQFWHGIGRDLSESGAGVESSRPLEVNSFVQVHAEALGISSRARVRHCTRRGAKYLIGLDMQRPDVPPAQEIRDDFVDYYELMQLGPTAELETVHRVYRILAARYHPDNIYTGDIEKFLLLRRSFETLSDPVKRAKYDAEYRSRQTQPMPVFELKEFVVGVDAEVNRRLGILCLLYNRRRADPDKPGLSLLEFEQLMTIPREHLAFTVWYLKEKQLVRTEGGAEFEITAEGVTFVEGSLPSNRLLQRLLRAPSDTADPGRTQSQTAASAGPQDWTSTRVESEAGSAGSTIPLA